MHHGFLGPFRCCLCHAITKSLDHIFVDCEFIQAVWNLILQELKIVTPLGMTVPDVYATWKDKIILSKGSQTGWSNAWYILPKTVWWLVWIARNDYLFNCRVWSCIEVAGKIKNQILEIMKNCNSKIPQEISEWLGSGVKGNELKTSKPFTSPPWRVRLPTAKFPFWWKSKGVATIFFYGAAKGNPGIAGVGGLIFSLDSEKFSSFCWGLGICSNNQVESYNLLMACQVAKKIGLKDIQIFGDFEVLIKLLNSSSQFNKPSLDKILQRIQNIVKDFDMVSFYHILRELNNQADSLANKACLLPLGSFSSNGEPCLMQPLP